MCAFVAFILSSGCAILRDSRRNDDRRISESFQPIANMRLEILISISRPPTGELEKAPEMFIVTSAQICATCEYNAAGRLFSHSAGQRERFCRLSRRGNLSRFWRFWRLQRGQQCG